ncbi:MAG: 23S rRNA (guanosine(2251)-2'-O)-methyltransferase RlmB [Clostridia bacterium]
MGNIYGKNPVTEAIEAGKTINKIFFQKGCAEVQELKKLALEHKIVVMEADKIRLEKMVETKNHQGVVASVTDYEYFEISDMLEYAKQKNEPPFIVILDKIEDPHNLGAIVRSCECAGVHGIIIQKRNACQVNDTVEKTAAGATAYMKIARVTNITESIKQLQKEGLWIYGLDMDGEKNIYETDFSGPIGIVVGNEGEGITRLVKETCDFVTNIPMRGNINSLNASVSTALTIYEVLRQKL